MRYETVAEAYRDLEAATGRLELIDRTAELIRATPDDELPRVCYLCQGLIAPQFAGIDLGLAEKLAIRAVAGAAGVEPEAVTAGVRARGDLGEATEALLPARTPLLTVGEVVETLHDVAAAEGAGSQGRKLDLLAGLLRRATPLEARYLLRLVTGNLRLGIGTPTILDALVRVHAGGKADRPVLERAYNICCDLGVVAQTLATGGLAAVEAMQVHPGKPVRVMLAQRLSEADEILARLGGECAAEYKYDGVRIQAHRTANGEIALFTRGLERVNNQFPDLVEAIDAALGPREAILEGEAVAYDAAAGELRPFQEVMFRRRKYGISEAVRDVPVSLFCFDLLYADGEDLTRAPVPRRRERLAAALTMSDRIRLTTTAEVSTPEALDGAFEQAIADGAEGLMCKSTGPDSSYRAGNRGLAVDQAEAGLPQRAVRHHRPGGGRRVRRPGPPPGRVRRSPAGRVRPGRRRCSAPSGNAAPGSPTRSWPSCPPGWPRTGWTTGRPWSTPGRRPTSGSSRLSCWRCSAPSSRSRPTPRRAGGS